MSEGLVCIACDEWFEVIFNNKPDNELCYCPLCGHEFTKEDFIIMGKETEEEK